jgi:hypothetical protein
MQDEGMDGKESSPTFDRQSVRNNSVREDLSKPTPKDHRQQDVEM